MNCQNTREQLVDYLENELSPAQRLLIQSHMAGCDDCQRELASLSAARSRLSQYLKTRAAQAVPAPQELGRLRDNLRASRSPWPLAGRAGASAGPTLNQSKGISAMKYKVALTALALVLVLGVTVAFVPPVRAQAEQLMVFMVQIKDLNGNPIFQISGAGPGLGFDLFSPTYMPDALKSSAGGGSIPTLGGITGSSVSVSAGPNATPQAGDTSTELFYQDPQGKNFLLLKQSKAAADGKLPAGESVTVNGNNAALEKELSGEYPPAPPDGASLQVSGAQTGSVQTGGAILESSSGDSSAPVPENGGTIVIQGSAQAQPASGEQPAASIAPPPAFKYTGAYRLTWFAGGTRLELTSNLPLAEIIKIAESMQKTR